MAEMASQDGQGGDTTGSEGTGEWVTVGRKSPRSEKGVDESRSVKWWKENPSGSGMKTSSTHGRDMSVNRSQTENKIEKYLRTKVGNSEIRKVMKEKEYLEENTVTVCGQWNSFLDTDDMIESIEKICGKGSVAACVPRGNRKYEVTLNEKSQCDLLIPTFKVGDVTVNANSVIQPYVVVSIMNLPVYTQDEEIIEKLEAFNLELVSPVYRTYRLIGNGAKIPDGTRFVHAIFPEDLKSLPYALKFKVRGKMEHFKVKHDNMVKVCNKCLSDEHLARNCTRNQCFRCSGYGHIAVDCESIERCENCNEGKNVCECSNHYYTDETDESIYSCETEIETGNRDDEDDQHNPEPEDKNSDQTDMEDEFDDYQSNESHGIESERSAPSGDPLDLTTISTADTDMETDEILRKRKAESVLTNMDEASVNKKKHPNTYENEEQKPEIRLTVNELRHPNKQMVRNQKETEEPNGDTHTHSKERHKLIKVEPNIGRGQRGNKGGRSIQIDQ